MSSAMFSTSFAVTGVILFVTSTLTGATGLCFLDRAFEPRRSARKRGADVAMGLASVMIAALTLLYACWLLRTVLRVA